MKKLAFVLFTPLAMSGCASDGPTNATNAAYVEAIDNWHAERVRVLRSETGWLTLAGLHRLESGEYSIGAAESNGIVLTSAPSPVLGVIVVTDGGVVFTAADSAVVEVFDTDPPVPVATVPLVSDATGAPTVLASGPVLFHIIDRSGELFLRVRDRNSPTLRDFTGIERFPVDPRWRVIGTLIPEQGATVAVPNILGQVETLPCPGVVEFVLEGKTHRLRPTLQADGSLFFVFADTTNGKETYGAGRFLKTDPVGTDGRVELDFNRAYNPVCSFSAYATCPLPPEGNRMPVAVRAGERHGG